MSVEGQLENTRHSRFSSAVLKIHSPLFSMLHSILTFPVKNSSMSDAGEVNRNSASLDSLNSQFISYLLLHNKLPQNLAVKNSNCLLSHSFSGSRIERSSEG